VRSPELDLEVYQGPFDLLLSLIMREEVDLLEVPLVEVITAYLADMEATGVTGYWDDMTEFLLLMSLLVEVKSRMLLPDTSLPFEEEELTPEQAREELLGRLFVYSQFKAAAEHLRALGDAGRSWVLRTPEGQAGCIPPPIEAVAGSGDVYELRDSLSRALAHRGDPDASHLAEIKIELRRQIKIVKDMLHTQESFSFNKVFGAEHPLVQALSLFALLDLLSRGEIRVRQPKVFGDILVKTRNNGDRQRGEE